MSISTLRSIITNAGATPSFYDHVSLLRQLIETLGGTPTQYAVIPLLRELITTAGGTPTQVNPTYLLRELVTAIGGTPETFHDDALWGQVDGLGFTPAPTTLTATWTTDATISQTSPFGNGWARLVKDSGGTSLTNAKAHTDDAFAGDFTFHMRRVNSTAECIMGVNNTALGDYLTIEHGADAQVGNLYHFDLGFASPTVHAGFTINHFAILSRVGTTVSLRMSVDPYHPGASVKDWAGDSTAYYGNLAISANAHIADIRMSDGVEYGFLTHDTVAWDAGAAINRGTHVETAPFARYVFDTTATSIDIQSYNNIFGTYPAFTELGLRVDGVYQSVPVGAAGAQTDNVILAAGPKRIEIINGLQVNPSDSVLGTFFTDVTGNAALTPVSEPSGDLILLYGDSITSGGNASAPTGEGWAMLVREAADNYRVGVEAWGSRSLNRDCGIADNRAGFVAKVKAWNPAILWMAIGTNDYGLNLWTAANFGTAYAALLDDLHTALPDLEIYCQTPISRTTETANGLGSTLPNYRTQIATAVSTRTGFCALVDGTAIITTGSLADGIHPTTAGHAIYGAAVISELGL